MSGTYDLVLAGGRIIDPLNRIDGPGDVAFKDGKVAAVASVLEHTGEVIDVSDCLVTPGLIDLHTHVYWGGTSLGVDPDTYGRSSAVTTAVDTGSAGPGNFAGFKAHVIDQAAIRILAYLHVSHAGIFAFADGVAVGESEDIRLMNPRAAAEVARSCPETIIGIKVRLGRHASGDQGMTPFAYALQVAEEARLPLMVHIDEPPPTYAEVVAALRKGDVLTHAFRPFPNKALGGDGEVLPEVLEARKRGVVFDIGHGMGSFSFDVAEAMLRKNFPPDVISSDVHALCANGPAFNQLVTLSKFLHLGMELRDVIRASTETPAAALGRPDLGSLTPGTVGDASVLRLEKGSVSLQDSVGATRTATQQLTPRAVILSGRLWHRV
jgi:dihydroorotase